MSTIFNKDNLAGNPEMTPKLRNMINTQESSLSQGVHINDNSRHINIGERKRWNESVQRATDYTDYQFMTIVGNFVPTERSKTIVEAMANEVVDRNKAISEEAKLREDADSEVMKALAKETQARLDSEQKINDSINQVVTQLREEAQARLDADSSLDKSIRKYVTEYTENNNTTLKTWVTQQIDLLRIITV